jgi:hypothetical protein
MKAGSLVLYQRSLPARICRARDGGASRRMQSGFHYALDGDASLGLRCPLAGSLKVSVIRDSIDSGCGPGSAMFREMSAPSPRVSFSCAVEDSATFPMSVCVLYACEEIVSRCAFSAKQSSYLDPLRLAISVVTGF